jgi:hypothetical protein
MAALHFAQEVATARLGGIVSRANLVRAVVGLARDKQGPAGDDAAIRTEVFQAIGQQPWAARVEVGVKGGMELSGVILNDHERAARVVATEKRFRRRGA